MASLNIKIANKWCFILTFLPPFIFTNYYPNGFILALQYSAIFATVIFVFIPVYLDKARKNKLAIYTSILGALVIVCQLINLFSDLKVF